MSEKYKSLLRVWTWLRKRIFIIYIFVYLVSLVAIDHDVTVASVRIKILNRFFPKKTNCFIQPKGCHKRDFKVAIRYYKRVIDYVPNIAEVYTILGYCYYQIGKVDQALKAFDNTIESNHKFFWAHYNKGVIYFHEKRYKEAIEALEEAVIIKPHKTLMIISESKVYRQILVGRPSAPIILDSKKVKPAYRNSYIILVLSYFHQGDYVNMFKWAVNAINAGYNEDGIFNFYQGLAIYHLGEYKQAAAFFTESLKHNGRSIDTNKYLALTLEKLGRKESADVFVERVAKLQIEGARSPEQDINVRIF